MHWIALRALPEAHLPLAGDGDLADALAALGWWALQFTPKVARLPGAVVLEVSASERLWGGVKPLLHRIYTSNKPVAHVQYARGATSLVALARLHDPAFKHTAPDDLPLHTLAAAQPHLATLARMGCTRWGDLFALPRGGVARRFGAPVLAALDQAYGVQPELYPWLVLPEVFEATLELSAQVESAPALLFGANRLLRQLQVWLQLRHRGVLAIELHWTLDARRHTMSHGQQVVRTAEPTSDMSHLQRLLAEHLARVTLPAPVLYLRLRTLETQALHTPSISLLPDEQPKGDSLVALLERLSARLGPQAVLRVQACADHRPELMQHWQPAVGAKKSIAGSAYAARARGLKDIKNGKDTRLLEGQHANALAPTWLLATPIKLTSNHLGPLAPAPFASIRLRLLAGPQRLEAAGWGGSPGALRDYFLARGEDTGLLWIYRDRLGAAHAEPPDWYWHGLFA
jgi:protein ImuB